MRIYVSNAEGIAKAASHSLIAQIDKKPDSVLGLATGTSPIMLYNEIVKEYLEGNVNFKRITSFNLDEYVGLSGDHEQSYRKFMEKHFFNRINIEISNTHIPNGEAENPDEECERYEELIRKAGGIDWQLLGIGLNGHIGFNEPGDSLIAVTHMVRLKEETRSANAKHFNSREEVPTHAMTVGMASILKAKKIIVIAMGREKAHIVQQTIMGPITTKLPASFLQIHPDVTFFLDTESAMLLPRRLVIA
ncbi:glucosamine-6-phosphate deaminase [Cohnella sp. REN36]|uniref:glucosamine-6-phosphate deaminase n=1 Tax=Cohnella sp. REN36 TaxID=2887347 RepID=UPI001D142B36|nr:glucosamine-6-phosphate deaminase [Cohnella sp. REN36]MCC3372329.1 glucosamine-6-phosphate deaminase [Cohnella sp. REN36]